MQENAILVQTVLKLSSIAFDFAGLSAKSKAKQTLWQYKLCQECGSAHLISQRGRSVQTSKTQLFWYKVEADCGFRTMAPTSVPDIPYRARRAIADFSAWICAPASVRTVCAW
eukprot:221538-Rhodomonas_salina.1